MPPASSSPPPTRTTPPSRSARARSSWPPVCKTTSPRPRVCGRTGARVSTGYVAIKHAFISNETSILTSGFKCPWCDGHEHADQALGLLASTFDDLPSLVREILTLNTDIIAFANGTDTPAARAETEAKNPKFQEYLDLHNVTIDNRTITAITRLKDGGNPPHDPSLPTAPEEDLFSVSFSEGEPVERAAFFLSYPDEQRSTIGAEAGVQLWGGRLAADVSKGYATNVAGIYAIGDANSDNSTNVPHALYTGKRTAVFLHVKLAKEDQAKETGVNVTALRRELDLEERSIWDVANGQPTDILYAGEYDQ